MEDSELNYENPARLKYLKSLHIHNMNLSNNLLPNYMEGQMLLVRQYFTFVFRFVVHFRFFLLGVTHFLLSERYKPTFV